MLHLYLLAKINKGSQAHHNWYLLPKLRILSDFFVSKWKKMGKFYFEIEFKKFKPSSKTV